MRIIKDSAVYLCGEIFAKIMPFLLLPYLTRKLGTAGFGELAYYQTIFALLVIVFGLSQDGAIARYYYFYYGKRNLHSIVYAGYLYTVIVGLIALALAWAMGSLVVMAVVSAAMMQCILSVQLTLRQCQKQVWPYTAIQIGSGVLGSLLTILFLELTAGMLIEKRFLALMLGNVSVSMIAAWQFLRGRPNVRLRKGRLFQSAHYILGFGLPLMLHHGAGFVKGQLDRMVLYPLYPAEQIGIYSAGFQVAMVLNTLLIAVNKALVPYYYQAVKDKVLNTKRIRRLALYGLVLAVIPAVLSALIPEHIFLWLLGEQYSGVKHFIVLFLLGFGLSIPYFILVNYLFYQGWNNRISVISLLSAGSYLVVLLITILLGPLWTPLAMIVSNMLILPLLFYQVKP